MKKDTRRVHLTPPKDTAQHPQHNRSASRDSKTYGVEPFRQFLKAQMMKGKISPPMLEELIGLEETNRLLDNAHNEMGKPALGAGTGIALHGQLHEFTGDTPDIKGQHAYQKEIRDENQKKTVPAADEHVQDSDKDISPLKPAPLKPGTY